MPIYKSSPVRCLVSIPFDGLLLGAERSKAIPLTGPGGLYTGWARLNQSINQSIQQHTGKWGSTVDSRLSAVMVGRIGADNQNQRINRSAHTQARYNGVKLTSLIFYAIN
jgi:hypothetical protein